MNEDERLELVELVATTVQKLNKRSRNDQGRGHPNLGVILKHYISIHGLSEADVAASVGKHPTFINKVIHGQRGISIETLAALQNVLGTGFSNDYLSEMDNLVMDRSF